ncbi:hypothetical protein NLI96_g12404 [Meripilus lineatus]|uniref:Uncharacterized protein n=1 Tax=Meripilus lineatus TaxID=2056292 RepID=A0AAD5UTY2_9APHY|nr:hypothetical protein NLI96_g12404 [Physisporinus lineatus]
MDARSTSVKIADLVRAAIGWHAGSRNAAVCETCSSPVQRSLSMRSELAWNFHPPLWALEIQGDGTQNGFDWLSAQDATEFSLDGGPTYSLIGVVYSGGNHFVCRYRDRDGEFWSHDSAEQTRFMRKDSGLELTHIGIDPKRLACTWIYMRN